MTEQNKSVDSNSLSQQAFVNKEQEDILKKLGLWKGARKITEKAVNNDSLNLIVSTIRTTEVTGGAMGTYKVEALRDCVPMVSFQWTYMIRGDNELWKVQASRRDNEGTILSGEITYDSSGTREDCLSSDDALVRAFVWLFGAEQTAAPFWLGEFSLAAGKSRWELITKSSCPACSSGIFCNC